MNLLAKRFPTILGLFLLLGLIGGALYYFRGSLLPAPPEIVPQKVTITNVSDAKFSVSWVSEAPTQGALEYGVVGETLASRAQDERDTGTTPGFYLTHHVTITGLQPSTQYAFRILAGDKPTRFDNNGSPYTTSTGPVIGAIPESKNFYGTVELPSKQSPEGAIVYLSLPGAAPASTLVPATGAYAFTISTIRSADLRNYISPEPNTVASVLVQAGSAQSSASVSLSNSAPVPTITLGQNADFRGAPQTPPIAQVEPAASSSPSAETPSIFNVEPLTEATDINAVTTGSVTLLNPKVTGETLATLRPEFRGTGPKGTTLSIAITGQKAVSDTTVVATDGTWTWSPVTDLKVGQQTITVSYVGTGGTTQKIERVFVVASGSIDPAFVSSPSASTKASATPVASATPRAAMPATDSGVPVTGVIENTLLTAGLSLVIMIVGALLLAL